MPKRQQKEFRPIHAGLLANEGLKRLDVPVTFEQLRKRYFPRELLERFGAEVLYVGGCLAPRDHPPHWQCGIVVAASRLKALVRELSEETLDHAVFYEPSTQKPFGQQEYLKRTGLRISSPSKKPLPVLGDQPYKECDLGDTRKLAEEVIPPSPVPRGPGRQRAAPRGHFGRSSKGYLWIGKPAEWEEVIPPSPPPPEPGRASSREPLSKEERKLILQAVKRDPDRNFSRIARQFGRSDMTVKRIATAEGIGPGPHSGVKISEEKRNEVVARLPLGLSFRAIAAQVGGITHKTVAKISKEESESPSNRVPQSRHLTAG